MQPFDVRPMPPNARYDTLLERIDQLANGETLRLVNDRDSLPLHYQLDPTRPHQFRWEYVEQGAEEWAVSVTRRAWVVDACPTLAAVAEPVAETIATASKVSDREVVVVYAPFKPVPLEGVLGEQGFTHVADRLDSGDWRVSFARH